jgi:tmRNA-binding protein
MSFWDIIKKKKDKRENLKEKAIKKEQDGIMEHDNMIFVTG